ncbi:MAG: endonuclease/exonuclease/phosphatase family protein [Planctomycetes bacterium]|nr:endonuclease/exonuclease/phosphatase family protein [Planctomycetota bacterium]
MPSSKWTAAGLAVVLSLVLVVGGCRDDKRAAGIIVMTQNVYYGFDVNPLLGATSPDDVPILAAQAFQQLVFTNFPERAAAIADEIGRRRPHLVALQEVALFRIQSPGDAVVGGTIPADAVLFDHLDILLTALAARGLEYTVAGKVQNVDVELPMLTSVSPLAFDDLRLTDYDVVLARKEVSISRASTANYTAKALVPTLGLEIPRGYVAVDAKIDGEGSVRFVTTHLEDAPFLDVQAAQVRELGALLAGETLPVLLAGDFNSAAPDGDAPLFLASQGYLDTWTRKANSTAGPGFTWGHDPDLTNPADKLTQRLDLVFVRPDQGRELDGVVVDVWGDELGERTASGMWASDHAGVVAVLRLRKTIARRP